MALTRNSIGKLAISGYPGHIFVCKLRYGYGHQEYIEKLEILHSWFSDLNAYLPVVFKGKESDYVTDKRFSFMEDGSIVNKSLFDLMVDVRKDIDNIYNEYEPSFEGQGLNGQEKMFIRSMRAIKEQLDVITAESKIIEGIKPEEGQEMLAG